MKLISSVLLIALTALPAFGQQSTREDFKEFCQAFAGRWLGDVTWIMDWPGFGKRGDKVTAFLENRITEDGNVVVGRFFGGPGSGSSVFAYDAGAKQIRGNGADSGGTVWTAVFSKQNGKWVSAETGSHADGTKYEGKYTVAISDGGNTHTWTGSTKITGKKADELKDVWRRVSK